MLPPGFESLPAEEQARHLRRSPGALVAEELGEAMAGRTKPLSEDDVAAAAPLIGQAMGAVTPVPSFVWKQLTKRILRFAHPSALRIVAVLIAAILPIVVYLNGKSLSAFLISSRLFGIIDWIKELFQ
jgi:hypothetical protein